MSKPNVDGPKDDQNKLDTQAAKLGKNKKET